MKVYAAFLRAINVGGTGMLPMKELVSLCGDLGFTDVKTYIQSGNVIFGSSQVEEKIKDLLQKSLELKMKKKVAVMIRTLSDLETILDKNPFSKALPSQVGVILFSHSIDENALKDIAISGPEKVVCSKREIYIYYPNGMGQSKLKLPKNILIGTTRNVNTLTKVIALMKEI